MGVFKVGIILNDKVKKVFEKYSKFVEGCNNFWLLIEGQQYTIFWEFKMLRGKTIEPLKAKLTIRQQ